MGLGDRLARRIGQWPAYRQLTGPDKLGRGAAAMSERTASLAARTTTADKVVKSICPYCAVGCGQNVYVKDDRVVQIEGDPDSPVIARPAVPEGLGARAARHRPARRYKVLHRRPVRNRMGGAPARRRDGDDRGPCRSSRARKGWQWEVDGNAPHGARSGSRTSAARRSTTKRTTSSRSSSPRSVRSRSRTRRASDTPRLSPVWGPRSVAAAPPHSSRTCRTLTASSSRAPTWPSAIRSGSSG